MIPVKTADRYKRKRRTAIVPEKAQNLLSFPRKGIEIDHRPVRFITRIDRYMFLSDGKLSHTDLPLFLSGELCGADWHNNGTGLRPPHYSKYAERHGAVLLKRLQTFPPPGNDPDFIQILFFFRDLQDKLFSQTAGSSCYNCDFHQVFRSDSPLFHTRRIQSLLSYNVRSVTE